MGAGHRCLGSALASILFLEESILSPCNVLYLHRLWYIPPSVFSKRFCEHQTGILDTNNTDSATGYLLSRALHASPTPTRKEIADRVFQKDNPLV